MPSTRSLYIYFTCSCLITPTSYESADDLEVLESRCLVALCHYDGRHRSPNRALSNDEAYAESSNVSLEPRPLFDVSRLACHRGLWESCATMQIICATTSLGQVLSFDAMLVQSLHARGFRLKEDLTACRWMSGHALEGLSDWEQATPPQVRPELGPISAKHFSLRFYSLARSCFRALNLAGSRPLPCQSSKCSDGLVCAMSNLVLGSLLPVGITAERM